MTRTARAKSEAARNKAVMFTEQNELGTVQGAENQQRTKVTETLLTEMIF